MQDLYDTVKQAAHQNGRQRCEKNGFHLVLWQKKVVCQKKIRTNQRNPIFDHRYDFLHKRIFSIAVEKGAECRKKPPNAPTDNPATDKTEIFIGPT